MSDPAPKLRDEPGDKEQYLPMSSDRMVIASRTAADRARGMRMAGAASRAQKLWVSRPSAFAFSGLVMPDPCEEPVTTFNLLTGIMAALGRHLYLGNHERHAVSLWIAHCLTIEWAKASPRLILQSAAVPTGKSTALRLLGELVPRPLAIMPSAAGALATLIDEVHPTLLLDDAHTWLNANMGLRRLLALGHARETLLQNPMNKPFSAPTLSVFTPCAATGRDSKMPSLNCALIETLGNGIGDLVTIGFFDGAIRCLRFCAEMNIGTLVRTGVREFWPVEAADAGHMHWREFVRAGADDFE